MFLFQFSWEQGISLGMFHSFQFVLWFQQSGVGCSYLLTYSTAIFFHLSVDLGKKVLCWQCCQPKSLVLVVRAGALQGCRDVHGCACWAGQLLVLCMMMVSVMCMTFSVGKWTVNTYSFFIGQITVLFQLSELPTPQKKNVPRIL